MAGFLSTDWPLRFGDLESDRQRQVVRGMADYEEKQLGDCVKR